MDLCLCLRQANVQAFIFTPNRSRSLRLTLALIRKGKQRAVPWYAAN